MSTTMPKSLYSSCNSWLIHILHIPCSATGLYILLNIFVSHAFSLFMSASIIGHVSLLYTATGCTFISYLLILIALLIALDLNICLDSRNIYYLQQSLILFLQFYIFLIHLNIKNYWTPLNTCLYVIRSCSKFVISLFIVLYSLLFLFITKFSG